MWPRYGPVEGKDLTCSERSYFRLYQLVSDLLLNLQALQKNKSHTVPSSSVFKWSFEDDDSF